MNNATPPTPKDVLAKVFNDSLNGWGWDGDEFADIAFDALTNAGYVVVNRDEIKAHAVAVADALESLRWELEQMKQTTT